MSGEFKIGPRPAPPKVSRWRYWLGRFHAWRDPEGYLRERGITVVDPPPPRDPGMPTN